MQRTRGIWGNEIVLKEKCIMSIYFFFSFLCTKMLNHVNRSLYGEKERVFILFVLMLDTKTLTYIQSSLYKETYQYYQRICIMGIFERKKNEKKLL